MEFSFHPATGRPCDVCDELLTHDTSSPIIDTHNGKASSANNFPFHNWYNFVLGYSPQFPEYMLNKEQPAQNAVVMDPFMGTGTTLISCKLKGIHSQGIDANDFMVDAARAKLTWNLSPQTLRKYRDQVIRQVEASYRKYRWSDNQQRAQPALFELQDADAEDYFSYVETRRLKMLLEKYISNKPLARAFMIDDAICTILPNSPEKALFDLALTSIIVPISNVRYGPGFGMVK